MNQRRNNIKGSLILGTAALIWGLAFVAQSDAADKVPPFLFNSLRSFIGALFLLAILWIKKLTTHVPILPTQPQNRKKVWIGGILCGVFLTISVNLQQFGITSYPAGAAAEARSGFLTALYVVMVPIITLFMVLFGINFVIYYKMLLRDWQEIRANEELKWYLAIYLGATAVITLILLPEKGNFFTALRYSSFQVASVVSTTGYGTDNFDLWPLTARMLILVLLFFGSCAGSTAGGMKICRVGMLSKQAIREVRHTIQPRKAMVVRFEGKAVDEGVLRQVATFAFIYVALVLVGGFLLSLENRYDMMTNFSAALTCVSNVGPGFGAVGPAGSFAGYGPFAKLLSSFLMLAGRLEIFPMLALFHPAMWRK